MYNLFKLGITSIEFHNEDFKSDCTPDNPRGPVSEFTAKLTIIQLRVNQGLALLYYQSEGEYTVLDSETGELLCTLKK